ncbi:hypothetical protein B0H66DRAFT_629668 [Apodospora peruviana]|uniref:TauD/TfdA-like domain-containing protein n=1 Tax=Apodospora peruviana TaxID=516989 RepID=A0AAE0HS49_9PEZI|nr:hypothetical protein B0H66DRAFT_614617 [Apodospora peruviana]KAK3313683.1 hypothetical protein B0H66DRAFT_629668 [Apodospora peruviana]
MSTQDPLQLTLEEAEWQNPDPRPTEVDVGSWPTCLSSPMAWTGQELRNPSAYTYYLSQNDMLEIDNGLKHFQDLGIWGGEITQQNFPLPTLSKKLAALSREVHLGRGFVNIRGLEVDRYSTEDTSLVYIGISKYIGTQVGKQDEGHALAHIRAVNQIDVVDDDLRPFRDSNQPLTYHTDGYCPIIGMQMRSKAAEGGEHLLASSWQVYNELAATRPDIIRILAAPNWHFDPRGMYTEPEPRALFFYEGESGPGAGDGKLIVNFVRYLLLGRPPGVPRLASSPDCTPEQVEALDAVEALARKHGLALDLRPGDIAFVNNWSIMHSRTAFRDGADDRNHTRYWVRIWLRNESPAMEWPVPAPLRGGHDDIFDRDHILHWNVTPQPRLAFKIYQTLTP